MTGSKNFMTENWFVYSWGYLLMTNQVLILEEAWDDGWIVYVFGLMMQHGIIDFCPHWFREITGTNADSLTMSL